MTPYDDARSADAQAVARENVIPLWQQTSLEDGHRAVGKHTEGVRTSQTTTPKTASSAVKGSQVGTANNTQSKVDPVAPNGRPKRS